MALRKTLFAVVASLPVLGLAGVGHAETIQEALARAYNTNPTLNAARAGLRGVDERVPQALAGWRPTVSASGSFGGYNEGYSTASAPLDYTYKNNSAIELSVKEFLFRGFRTINSTRQAKALVRAQRANLQSVEQDVLLSAAQAYVDVLRDSALVALQRSDVAFLNEQVRATEDRLQVGAGTKTDVSQANARYAEARANLNSAVANLNASRATYRQVIGQDPASLSASTSITHYMPHSMEDALSVGESTQPLIQQASNSVDAANYNVKAVEGELLPTVSIEGSVGRQVNPNVAYKSINQATIMGRVNIPLYQAGGVTSRVRQAKEELGQTQIQLDEIRARVRANIISAWGNYQAAVASIGAAEQAVQAQKLALDGVIEEQRVGQRTTLDVLDAQRELVNQRANLVTAQRNRVVSGYQLLASIGRLDAKFLGLKVQVYDATAHYRKVRDKWYGLRTTGE